MPMFGLARKTLKEKSRHAGQGTLDVVGVQDSKVIAAAKNSKTSSAVTNVEMRSTCNSEQRFAVDAMVDSPERPDDG